MNFKKSLSLLLALILILPVFSGCNNTGTGDESGSGTKKPTGSVETSEPFNYSEGIDENGYWSGIKALDFVTLPQDISSVNVPRAEVTVTDEEYEENLLEYLGDFLVEVKVYDRPVEDDDTVNIDYVGSVDGVEFAGGSTGGKGTTVIIGETKYIDDFLDQLVDAMPGDTVNVEVTFPDPYQSNTDLSGKDALFVTKINYIIDYELPEITDEFVTKNLKEYTDCSTAEEFHEYFRNLLYEIELSEYIQKYIEENVVVSSVPESLYQYQVDSMIAYYDSMAASYGMTLDYILSALTGYATVEQLIEGYREENEKGAKSFLVYQAIAENAQIVVTDDDIKAYFKEYVGVDDYSAIIKNYGAPYVKMMVLNQLALDHCLDNATIVD